MAFVYCLQFLEIFLKHERCRENCNLPISIQVPSKSSREQSIICGGDHYRKGPKFSDRHAGANSADSECS